MKIVIDGGHHASTPGKRSVDDSLREAHFNHDVADRVKKLLEKYKDVEVIFTHSGTYDVPLQQRVNTANKKNANVFISIHANAAGSGYSWNSANGIETYTATSKPDKAVKLANLIQNNLIKNTNLRNRGVKHSDFYVLKQTKMTAVLVECGFMTNRDECKLMLTSAFRDKIANGIVDALVSMYGLKKKNIVQQVQDKLNVQYRVIAGSFSVRTNALKRQDALRIAEVDTYIQFDKDTKVYRVIAGTYKLKTNATAQMLNLNAKGFEATILAVKK